MGQFYMWSLKSRPTRKWRMLQYRFLLRDKVEATAATHQVILRVGDSRPALGVVSIDDGPLTFSCQVVDSRALAPDAFLQSDRFDDNALALACGGDLRDTLRLVAARYFALPEADKDDAAVKLLAVANLRMVSADMMAEAGLQVTVEMLEQNPLMARRIAAREDAARSEDAIRRLQQVLRARNLGSEDRLLAVARSADAATLDRMFTTASIATSGEELLHQFGHATLPPLP
jgi:hypothetical protein